MNNIINRLLGSEFVKGKTIIEKAYGKWNFRRYYAKFLENGEVEFWSHTTIPLEGYVRSQEKKSYYLGKFNGREWIKPEDYYQIPWMIQKGAERLHRMFIRDL